MQPAGTDSSASGLEQVLYQAAQGSEGLSHLNLAAGSTKEGRQLRKGHEALHHGGGTTAIAQIAHRALHTQHVSQHLSAMSHSALQ